MDQAITVGVLLWVVGGGLLIAGALVVIYFILKAFGEGFHH